MCMKVYGADTMPGPDGVGALERDAIIVGYIGKLFPRALASEMPYTGLTRDEERVVAQMMKTGRALAKNTIDNQKTWR